MSSVINKILDSDWVGLKEYVETRAKNIVQKRINEKKVDILAKINNVDKKEMKKILKHKNQQ